MAKKIKTVIKLQIKAGQANPAPPVGPALGQHGLNIQDFCVKFNEATKDKQEMLYRLRYPFTKIAVLILF